MNSIATKNNTNGTVSPKELFTSWDYAVMISSLLISTIIGSAYALRAAAKSTSSVKKSTSKAPSAAAPSSTTTTTTTTTANNDSSATRRYFQGSALSFVPVTLSLIASRVSPNTTIGFPVEVYQHGISIWFFVLGELLGCVFAAVFCLPVFYPLQFHSVYEILERRFGSRSLRLVCSSLYVIKIVMYLGVVLYGPAIALSSVTPLSIDASILTCGVLCCVYTTLGGLGGVIWTDVFQICVMIGAQIAVLVLGVAGAGGWGQIWRVNEALGRIKLPETRFDFHSRHSFWNIILAPTLEWTMQMGAAQMAIQRLKGLPSMRQAVACLLVTGVAVVAVTTLSMAAGLIVTARFAGCDPLATGLIDDENQYLPYLVLLLFKDYPGLTGLFVSAIFCATLSSISSGINAVANVIWDDFLRRIRRFRDMPDKKSAVVVRCVSFLFGAIPIGIAFAAKSFGDNVQKMGTVFVAVTAGAMNAMFIGCYFVRIANAKGLMVGSLASVLVIGWWVMGGTVHPPPVDRLPIFDHCLGDHATNDGSSLTRMSLNLAEVRRTSPYESDGIDWSSFPFCLYNMSYLWYQIIGTVIALLVGILFSAIFDFFDRRKAAAAGVPEKTVDDAFLFSWAKLTKGLKRPAKVGQQPGGENYDGAEETMM